MIADAIGISIPEAMKRAERGTLSAAQAIPALLEGMTQKFGGMMEQQSQSLIGLWSTAKDNIGASLRVIGDSLVETFDLKTKLKDANKWLGDFAKEMKEGGLRQALTQMIPEGLRNSILMVAGALTGAMVPALTLTAISALKAVAPLLPFMAVGAAIAGLGILIAKNWENPLVKFAAFALTLGAAITALTNAKLAMLAYSAVTKIATAVQAALNVVMSMNPIGLIVMAIGALILAGIALYKNWDTVKRIALNVWGEIKAVTLNVVAMVVEAWGKFVGVFNKAEGDRIKASAQAMREQAENEREMIQRRNSMAEGFINDEETREEDKLLKKHLREQKAADQEIQTVTNTAATTTEIKKDFLEEFDEAFDRSQQDQLEAFDRAQEDQTESFKRAQEDKLTAFGEAQKTALAKFDEGQKAELDRFKANQKAELTEYERTQADKLTVFKNAQEQAKIRFEQSQEDARIRFENGLANEKERFERHQEDLLSAFKNRQAKEAQALEDRQERERRALDAEYAAKIGALEKEQRDMERAAQAEARAKAEAEAQARVDTAKRDVGRALALNDPAALAAAQARLAEAEAAQAELLAKGQREVNKDRITDAIAALRSEHEQRKTALHDAQKLEDEKLKEKQAKALANYERELEDQQTAFGRRLEQRKLHYQREAEEDALAFETRQAEALVRYQRELDDNETAFKSRQEKALLQREKELEADRKAFTDKQAEALLQFKRLQEDEATEWARAQEDRALRYKRELEDLKASFAEKLAEQAEFVRDWNAMAAKMKSMAPDASGTIPDASTASAPEPIMMAKGGVLTRPIIAGEAGPEPILPLSWLDQRMRSISAGIVNRLTGASVDTGAGVSSGAARAQGGQGAAATRNGPETVVVQNVLDGKVISETVLDIAARKLRQTKRSIGNASPAMV